MKKFNRLVALLLVTVMMLSSCSALEGEDGVSAFFYSLGQTVGGWIEGLFGGGSSSGADDIGGGGGSADTADETVDEIMIIDTSASMFTLLDGVTRLRRAVERMCNDIEAAFDAGNRVSIIVAAEEACVEVREVGADEAHLVYNVLDGLIFDDVDYNFYEADISGAMELADMVASFARESRVTLYTDTVYENTGDVTVYNVTDPGEWNAAILDVRAFLVDNYYRIEIDVVSYGRSINMAIACDIYGVNSDEYRLNYESIVTCINSQVTTVVLGFNSEGAADMAPITEEVQVYSFDHIGVSISADDSFEYDNSFWYYGGVRLPYRVLVYTENEDSILPDVVSGMRAELSEYLDIEYVVQGIAPSFECDGFDLYIYEGYTPDYIPTDGTVLFINPPSLPDSVGMVLGSAVTADGGVYFNGANNHELTEGVNASAILVDKLTSVSGCSDFDTILTATVDNTEYPMLLLKENAYEQILVMPFAIEDTNLSELSELTKLLLNTVDYFKFYIDEPVRDAGEVFFCDAKHDLYIVTPDGDVELPAEFMPAELKLNAPGIYTVTWCDISGVECVLHIFVKVPASESNIFAHADSIPRS